MIVIVDHNPGERYNALPTEFVLLEDELQLGAFAEQTRLFIILAELLWSGKRVDDFQGFAIVKLLRVKYKSLAPIIILSTLPEQVFINLVGKRPEIGVILTPGHHYINLAAFDAAVINVIDFPKIDELTLSDINNHIFSIEGQLDQEIHDLVNKLLSDDKNKSKTTTLAIGNSIKRFINNLENCLDLLDPKDFNALVLPLIMSIKDYEKNKVNLEELITVVITVGNHAKVLLQGTNDGMGITSSFEHINLPWKVLYLEDTIGNTTLVQNRFKDRNIRCDIVNNPNDAFLTISNDFKNEYVIFISDYRLKKEQDSGRWFPYQGYKVLEKIFLEYSNLCALFVLTSFNRKTLLKMQQKHKMKVHTYSKQDVLASESGFNVFCESILEQGNKFYELVLSKPKSSSWNNGYLKKFDLPLKEYYRMHRLAHDFEAQDIIVSNISTTLFEYAKAVKYKQERGHEFINLNIQEGIGKDKTARSDNEKIKKFRNKLIGRRVAIALYDLLEMDKAQIYWTMKTGQYKNIVNEGSNVVNQYFSTYMGLSLEKDIPDNLLPEEKIWLETLQKQQYGF